MKKLLLTFIIIILLSFKSYSQVHYENGYFINLNNQKIECLIESMDWRSTPTSFKYKISENSEIITADISSVKEFSLNGKNKFISAVVKIDRSNKPQEELSNYKNPDFKEEKLFLQVLLEGKASLYLNEGYLKLFFYKTDDGEIKQLVYKRYTFKDDFIATNNDFRNQLYLDLKCDKIAEKEYKKIYYTNKDLIKIFSKYNECYNSDIVYLETKEKKVSFKMAIRPRYNTSSFSVKSPQLNLNTIDFGNSSNPGLGLEAEFILPFNQNKWSLTIEPLYQYYKGEGSVASANVQGGLILATVDYKSIELPLGVRRYFDVNDNFKIFTNALFSLDFTLDSKLNFFRKDGSGVNSLNMKSGMAFGLGIGCKLNNKYSVELRYETPRSLTKSYSFYDSSYKSASLIVGYSFL